MEIFTRPVVELVPYHRHLRKNDHAVQQMVASIQEFGFKVPVLVRSTGEIVDGDLRLKAAMKLRMTEVPVILCDEWSEAQVKAFRLLVNRSANWADWDLDLVSLEIGELKGLDFDLQLTGFDRLKSKLMNHLIDRSRAWATFGCVAPTVYCAGMRRRPSKWHASWGRQLHS